MLVRGLGVRVTKFFCEMPGFLNLDLRYIYMYITCINRKLKLLLRP